MHIGMSNDFYRPTKIASCARGFSEKTMLIIFRGAPEPIFKVPAGTGSDRNWKQGRH